MKAAMAKRVVLMTVLRQNTVAELGSSSRVVVLLARQGHTDFLVNEKTKENTIKVIKADFFRQA